jgi:hypothetical protein
MEIVSNNRENRMDDWDEWQRHDWENNVDLLEDLLDELGLWAEQVGVGHRLHRLHFMLDKEVKHMWGWVHYYFGDYWHPLNPRLGANDTEKEQYWAQFGRSRKRDSLPKGTAYDRLIVERKGRS